MTTRAATVRRIVAASEEPDTLGASLRADVGAPVRWGKTWLPAPVVAVQCVRALRSERLSPATRRVILGWLATRSFPAAGTACGCTAKNVRFHLAGVLRQMKRLDHGGAWCAAEEPG